MNKSHQDPTLPATERPHKSDLKHGHSAGREGRPGAWAGNSWETWIQALGRASRPGFRMISWPTKDRTKNSCVNIMFVISCCFLFQKIGLEVSWVELQWYCVESHLFNLPALIFMLRTFTYIAFHLNIAQLVVEKSLPQGSKYHRFATCIMYHRIAAICIHLPCKIAVAATNGLFGYTWVGNKTHHQSISHPKIDPHIFFSSFLPPTSVATTVVIPTNGTAATAPHGACHSRPHGGGDWCPSSGSPRRSSRPGNAAADGAGRQLMGDVFWGMMQLVDFETKYETKTQGVLWEKADITDIYLKIASWFFRFKQVCEV